MEMKTTLKYCISLALEPQGVFIGTSEGGQGTTPSPKLGPSRGRTAAASPSRPRKCGLPREARATLWAARCPVCPLSASAPSF